MTSSATEMDIPSIYWTLTSNCRHLKSSLCNWLEASLIFFLENISKGEWSVQLSPSDQADSALFSLAHMWLPDTNAQDKNIWTLFWWVDRRCCCYQWKNLLPTKEPSCIPTKFKDYIGTNNIGIGFLFTPMKLEGDVCPVWQTIFAADFF